MFFGEKGKAAKSGKIVSGFDSLAKAHALVLSVYGWTEGFPRRELYGLTSHLRRATVSIPANIAEGFKKRGPKYKLRFLNIAQGSLEETRYYLILADDLGYGCRQLLIKEIEQVSNLLEAYALSVHHNIFSKAPETCIPFNVLIRL